MTDMIVPSFDDETPTGRKLAIICSKGNLDMAYPGLILANAALGEGIEVHLFFTFWGFDIINKETMGNLKFSYLGNTAMHMPGHFGMSMPQGMAGLPGVTAMTTKMLMKQISDLVVPDVPANCCSCLWRRILHRAPAQWTATLTDVESSARHPGS